MLVGRVEMRDRQPGVGGRRGTEGPRPSARVRPAGDDRTRIEAAGRGERGADGRDEGGIGPRPIRRPGRRRRLWPGSWCGGGHEDLWAGENTRHLGATPAASLRPGSRPCVGRTGLGVVRVDARARANQARASRSRPISAQSRPMWVNWAGSPDLSETCATASFSASLLGDLHASGGLGPAIAEGQAEAVMGVGRARIQPDRFAVTAEGLGVQPLSAGPLAPQQPVRPEPRTGSAGFSNRGRRRSSSPSSSRQAAHSSSASGLPGGRAKAGFDQAEGLVDAAAASARSGPAANRVCGSSPRRRPGNARRRRPGRPSVRRYRAGSSGRPRPAGEVP